MLLRTLLLVTLPLVWADPGPSLDWNIVSPADYQAISSTIILDADSTDSKNFDVQSQIFTEDVKFSYSANSNGTGLAAITAAQKAGVTGYSTQHLIGNILIAGCRGGKASASYSAIATLFVDPQQSPGQVVSLSGYYNVDLVKTRQGWRISNLVYRFYGPGKNGNVTLG